MQKRKRKWPKVLLIIVLTLGILCGWGALSGTHRKALQRSFAKASREKAAHRADCGSA